ncbi:MAG: SusD/RagB family nutrient-binding outer membrane lipoprotein [Porphyromonadaceae bacterium]|nr:MAG: SusD/RagB family nutrient-binding outer membrane lipoprotein [Porphyromonadaceae bacterium]
MKKNILYFILATLTSLFANSCTKDFENINVDPSIVSNVDVKFLFTSSQEKLQGYRSTEWPWEDMEQTLRLSQLLTAETYELSNNVNTRYGTFYSGILPNLFEIRRLINNKADKERFRKIYATTYIVQIYQGLKVTDMNGSIPYTEANQGRDIGNYSPKYDSQKTLYDTWLKELSDAIKTLQSSLTDQEAFGNNDIFYKGDWTKWIKLANSLKLRIAARYQNPDPVIAAQIFKEVMTDAVGPFVSTDDQMTYNNNNYLPFSGTGYMIDYRSRRYAVETVVDFMKSTGDPRLGIYFDKNGLVGSFQDTLAKYSKTLPAWCVLSDPKIMYQGGPADFQANPARSTYFSNPFDAGGGNRYLLISTINRRFFSPTVEGGSGKFVDVLVSYAEVCFHVAEFIQKGYGAGFDTKGTAADWYNKGVRASAKTMNDIAFVAGSTSVDNIDPLIDTYLTHPKVILNGNDNLEKIYIQQLLNFYRQGNEAFTLVRRTGYPKFTSTLLAREALSEIVPRRFWLLDPGEVNNVNWNAAMQEQGFTPNDRSLLKLNSERIWFDKNSPNFGEGN